MADKKKTVIITTSSMDCACAAAILLHKKPESEVITSSITRLNTTLEDLLIGYPESDEIHICGVGIEKQDIEELKTTLSAVRNSGYRIIWHCGRGYLNRFSRMLEEFCELNFKDLSSNAEAVANFAGNADNEEVKQLLDLADEYVSEGTENIQEKNIFWHKFINNSAAKLFRFGDNKAFPTAIRKLAGVQPLTEYDRREVETIEISGKEKLPTGKSREMDVLRRNISHAAPHIEPVLILGPTGSGKELAARSVHEGSPRAARQFIAINCATFAENSDMAHDRLFGHVKGAYTGAAEKADGAFQVADGGTLFLDEVAELPLDTQTSLLRVLEEKTVSPLGSMEKHNIDVRIIAATNRNIPQMIRDGKFRLDLFYRLNVLTLNVPALKERKEDLRSIVANVSHELRREKHELEISEAGWDAIYNYDWPGNVRQFINVLKRSVYMDIPIEQIVEDEKSLNLHLEEDASEVNIRPTSSTLVSYPSVAEEILTEDEFRRNYMQRAYSLMGGNVSETARVLQVSRNTLKKWLSE